ncbi:hypothetical protein SporoP37_14240 [Sporosarcina sp. P37]|nr:hypothetical protein SporoP33_13905 [Sporosarcina sp. P33]ARK25701.1 hypothetical protein SporoP37_14240 [Sporosarcina sp. P37]PID19277.1 hypothetical protein CSV62_04850 [Sporosarcina sp. P35]
MRTQKTVFITNENDGLEQSETLLELIIIDKSSFFVKFKMGIEVNSFMSAYGASMSACTGSLSA